METPLASPSQQSGVGAPQSSMPVIEEAPSPEATTSVSAPTPPFAQQQAPEPPIETVVVPPSAPASPEKGEQNTQVPPPNAPAGGNSWFKRILMFGVFMIIIVAIIISGRFVWGFVSGGNEVTINYWGLWENDAVIRNMITDFEASHPKIKVQYAKQSPKQYRERLAAAIDRGEGPDAFRFHNTWVPMLARYLALVPKTIMTTSDFYSTFYPVAGADLVAGNNIYAIPLMIDGLGLYYNEDLLASAGVNVPATWNDVLDIAPKLTVKNENGIITSAIALGTTGNVEHFSDILAVMILQNGAKLTNLKSKEAEEALIFYHKFADPADPVYTWNDALDNSVSAFANGRVAMILAPSWRAFDIKQINPNLRFKIAPIPQLPGNTVTWASYWVEGVSSKSKNQAAAWEFIKYLTGKEAATKLYTDISKNRLFGEPYARVDLGSSLATDPFVGAFVSQAKTAKSFPLASRTFDNGLNDKLIKYLEDAVNSVSSGNSPASALETAQAGFTQVLSTYGLSPAASAPK